MKLALARPHRRGPRFFSGRYDGSFETGSMSPVTTGHPDRAQVYDERVVAELVAVFLNLLVGIRTGENSKPWIIIELPEAWV